jgi:hypothetical protein
MMLELVLLVWVLEQPGEIGNYEVRTSWRASCSGVLPQPRTPPFIFIRKQTQIYVIVVVCT